MNDLQAIQQDHERFLQYLQKHHVMDTIHIRYNYTDVLNGMSIELVPRTKLSAAALTNHTDDFVKNTLATCPYVRRYWPGKRYARPNTIRHQYTSDAVTASDFFSSSVNGDIAMPLVVDTGSPNLQMAHEWTTVSKAKQMGWTGRGVRIGILDTGVDYTHPSLGGCFGVREN
jgi:subtilisin family serine protease